MCIFRQELLVGENTESLFNILEKYNFLKIFIASNSDIMYGISRFLASKDNFIENFPEIYVSTKNTEADIYFIMHIDIMDGYYSAKRLIFDIL